LEDPKNVNQNETSSNKTNVVSLPAEHPKIAHNTQSTEIDNATNDNILNEGHIIDEEKNLTLDDKILMLDDIKDVSQENFLRA